MYVPLQVEPHFWFKPRVELDSRLSPSPSTQALKVVRDMNKKHLRFISEHEKKLLQWIDPEDANHIYMQFGLKQPQPGEDPCSKFNNRDVEPYRRGDLEPITVVGLRSHHHPVAQVRAQALATWQTMRDNYYNNQQATDSSSWVVQNDSAFSEAAIWTTQEIPGSQDLSDSSTSASTSTSASDSDNDYNNEGGQWDLRSSSWSGGGGDTDLVGEQHSDLFPELSGGDHWLTELPTSPHSDTCSPPPSPVPSDSQLVTTADDPDPIPPTDLSVPGNSGLSAREELSQVLNDRKIMEAFLDGILKQIKLSYMSKSEREAEKAVERQRYRTTHRKGQKSLEEARGDPRRSLHFCRSVTMCPKQAELHKLEETCRSHFKTHFQMTHQYEDAVGKVHAEPVATEGLPPGNRFGWMKAQREQQSPPW